MLGTVEEDEVRRPAELDQATVEVAEARGVAGREAEGDLRRHVAERGKHRDHAEDAERLDAGAGGRVGAEDDALELLELPRRAEREERGALVAVVDELEAAAAAF